MIKKKNYFSDKWYSQLLNQKNQIEKFGIDSNFKWSHDPRQFFISQARYKFVSKVLAGEKKVLEIGAADGFNSRIVSNEVKNLELSDNEEHFRDSYLNYINKKWKKKYFIHDFIKRKYSKKYSAIYMLDVLEHIPNKSENKFLSNICNSLEKTGTLIVGIPSLEFQKFSNKDNGHINCKTGENLKKFLKKYFHNVYLFSMNDEVVSTSLLKMACYFLAICSHKKK